MARYINANKFEKYILDRYNTMEMVGINQVVNFIKEQPTADVKEVVRGEWIFDILTGFPKCSICGVRCHNGVWNEENNYCGHCGADMKEGADDE